MRIRFIIHFDEVEGNIENMADNWKNITDADEIDYVTEIVESALDGKQFSATDDDTSKRLGRRYGTRHHMNDCTLNPKLSNATFQKRGKFAKISYRIETLCTITAAYIRIEYKTTGSEKKDDTLRQECTLEVIMASSGSSVKVLRLGDAAGSGDGRNRMMNYVPLNLTTWLNNELKN